MMTDEEMRVAAASRRDNAACYGALMFSTVVFAIMIVGDWWLGWSGHAARDACRCTCRTGGMR